MFKNLIYNYYYKKFIKENSKDKKEIDWNKWSRYDEMCERYSK
jgi:hypothetical protein